MFSNEAKLFERQFPSSIKGFAHKRFDEDYKVATWRKYFSFSRAAMLSSPYKKLLELKKEIEVHLS
jgi:hypothetical protein